MSAPIPPTTLDRIMAYVRMLVRAELPRLSFLGVYEYVVQGVGAGGATYDIVPTDNTISLPGSKGVPLRLSCATATLTQGSLVVLAFLNGDPSKPVLIGGAPKPTIQTIDASATLNLGPNCPTNNIGTAPTAAALANAVQAMTDALNTYDTAVTAWVAAFATALAGNATYTLFQAAMVGPSGTLATAGSALAGAYAALKAAIPAKGTNIT